VERLKDESKPGGLRSPTRSFSLALSFRYHQKYCPLVRAVEATEDIQQRRFSEPDGPVIDSHSPRRNT